MWSWWITERNQSKTHKNRKCFVFFFPPSHFPPKRLHQTVWEKKKKKKSQKQHVSHIWHGLKRWDVIVYTKRSICWRKFAAFRYGRAWSASEETRAVESEGCEMSGGKYFPDSLMIASCQITNWISSCWRRASFSPPFSRITGSQSLFHSAAAALTRCRRESPAAPQARWCFLAHLYKSCWLGRICSSLLMFFSLKVSTAGEGLLVNTLMMPVGNDRVISPVIFTMHLLIVATSASSLSQGIISLWQIGHTSRLLLNSQFFLKFEFFCVVVRMIL